MIKTTIIVQVSDDKITYRKGDRVRIKMKPRNMQHPECASEYIGCILHIVDGCIFLDIGIDTRLLEIRDIDMMRFALLNETFDNKWNF